MKIVTALVLLMAFATIAFAADPPKEADTVDYSMDAPSRIVIDGELTESSPTWHRWRPASYSELGLNCDLVMTSDYTTEPYFDMYCFNVADERAGGVRGGQCRFRHRHLSLLRSVRSHGSDRKCHLHG